MWVLGSGQKSFKCRQSSKRKGQAVERVEFQKCYVGYFHGRARKMKL